MSLQGSTLITSSRHGYIDCRRVAVQRCRPSHGFLPAVTWGVPVVFRQVTKTFWHGPNHTRISASYIGRHGACYRRTWTYQAYHKHITRVHEHKTTKEILQMECYPVRWDAVLWQNCRGQLLMGAYAPENISITAFNSSGIGYTLILSSLDRLRYYPYAIIMTN